MLNNPFFWSFIHQRMMHLSGKARINLFMIYSVFNLKFSVQLALILDLLMLHYFSVAGRLVCGMNISTVILKGQGWGVCARVFTT